MPSPFPGMNAYIERAYVWHDFHETFMVTARAALTAQVQPKYYVALAEHVFIEEPSNERPRPLNRPYILNRPANVPRSKTNSASPVALATVLLPPPVEVVRESYLEIRDSQNEQLVTVINLLSPINKAPGFNRSEYSVAIQKVIRSPNHLVELDLLRGGPRMPWGNLPACDYYAVVSRYENRPLADFWSIGLRDPLPSIPIPLRPGEPEPVLELQAILHQTYDSAGYDYYIYDGDPEPPLSPEDAAWAASLRPAR